MLKDYLFYYDSTKLNFFYEALNQTGFDKLLCNVDQQIEIYNKIVRILLHRYANLQFKEGRPDLSEQENFIDHIFHIEHEVRKMVAKINLGLKAFDLVDDDFKYDSVMQMSSSQTPKIPKSPTEMVDYIDNQSISFEGKSEYNAFKKHQNATIYEYLISFTNNFRQCFLTIYL